MTKIDESRPFLPVNIAVMTVSDTRSAADDRSGDTLVARIEGAGHVLADRRIVADDIDVIVASLENWIADPVAGGSSVFGLPGSHCACKDGWDEILQYQLDNRTRPCNFVELMPRLQEPTGR